MLGNTGEVLGEEEEGISGGWEMPPGVPRTHPWASSSLGCSKGTTANSLLLHQGPQTPRGCWHLGVLLLPPLIFEGLLPPHAWVRARSLLCRLLLSEAAFGLSMSIFGHPTSIYGHLLPCPDVAAGGALFSAHTAQLLGALITPVQNPSAGR